MIETQQATDSFIFAEEPVTSATCAKCQQPIKTSIDKADKPVWLSIPYQIRSVTIEGGRAFEKISSCYAHVCSPSGVSPQDSFRSIFIGQSALL